MTEQERLALHEIKGMLKAYGTIFSSIYDVAGKVPSVPQSKYMEGFSKGQRSVASSAILKTDETLAEVEKLLLGVFND